VAQVVSRSGVGAGDFGLGAGIPGSGLALPGEGFDGPVEVVTGWAPDHGALQGPVARLHGEPAPDLGGEPASFGTFTVQVGGAVEEHHRVLGRLRGQLCQPLVIVSSVGWARVWFIGSSLIGDVPMRKGSRFR
jgi:hypothetical protein